MRTKMMIAQCCSRAAFGQLRMSTTTTTPTHDDLDAVFKQKRLIRTQVRKTLKSIQPSLRSHQGGKKLYVPRVEDKNSHMRMLHISRIDDLVANSMDILEPAPVDADGNAREDGTSLAPFCFFVFE
ncbi:hypothetical protein V8G54_007943 [Vigna mungo]|uniref:5-formyltetrahydrofolate cyclo-ligase n=1 Tax=Vigna mungo TaxID=3915 RepID=A0AAQ3P269_VIGMU